MAFGDVQQQAASPSSIPFGIGGDANTIWHNDTSSEKVYELDANINQPPTATATARRSHLMSM